MKIKVQIDIKEIIWQGDAQGFITRKCGSCKSFQVEMWESESLKDVIKETLEKETGYRPETWKLQTCLVIGECNG